MVTKTYFGYVFFAILLVSEQALGRPVLLYPRRFGQEQPAVLQKLREACPGQVCGTLAGQAVTPLLAAQPECSQQDMADAIIDASRQFDAITQENMIAIAKEYRQVEKNTPPDFTTNPPTLRNSVFCQNAPKNSELDGLVQAQDPANDPDIFFDPALKKSVRKGEQANTFPFNGAVNNNNDGGAVGNESSTPTSSVVATATPIGVETSGCPTVVTVTVSATNSAAVSATNAITVTVGKPSQTQSPSPSTTTLPSNVDFGSCTTPEIEFATGFDNRRETSFRPVDRDSYPHDSAQNINIITQFICDSLTNLCGANQAAKDLCGQARTAASSAKVGTGAQADAFNSVFGIQTSFVDVASVDNQGNVMIGTGAVNSGNGNTVSTSRGPVRETATSTSPPSTPVPTSTSPVNENSNGNFGSCTTPEIEFGAGFDGRRETSFRPVDLESFNHGSANNIDIITKSICNQLTNSCGADEAAKDTCARAVASATASATGTGAQADAFNAVFGISTNFANVPQIDNQGRVVGVGNTAPTTTSQSAETTSSTNRVVSSSVTPTPLILADNSGSTQPNLQSFNESLGGVAAPVVTDIGNGRFEVEGNAQFNDRTNALVRSCDVQNNRCADAANASGNQNGFTVQACNEQQAKCKAAVGV